MGRESISCVLGCQARLGWHLMLLFGVQQLTVISPPTTPPGPPALQRYFVCRILGLRVLGYTGDGDKASWIKTDLNLDWAFNYKTQDVNQTLNIAAPNGVDIFFDGVGGQFSATVLQHMAMFGRVIMVGNLSSYNHVQTNITIPSFDLAIALKELTIVGFNVYR